MARRRHGRQRIGALRLWHQWTHPAGTRARSDRSRPPEHGIDLHHRWGRRRQHRRGGSAGHLVRPHHHRLAPWWFDPPGLHLRRGRHLTAAVDQWRPRGHGRDGPSRHRTGSTVAFTVDPRRARSVDLVGSPGRGTDRSGVDREQFGHGPMVRTVSSRRRRHLRVRPPCARPTLGPHRRVEPGTGRRRPLPFDIGLRGDRHVHAALNRSIALEPDDTITRGSS